MERPPLRADARLTRRPAGVPRFHFCGGEFADVFRGVFPVACIADIRKKDAGGVPQVSGAHPLHLRSLRHSPCVRIVACEATHPPGKRYASIISEKGKQGASAFPKTAGHVDRVLQDKRSTVARGDFLKDLWMLGPAGDFPRSLLTVAPETGEIRDKGLFP